MDPDFTREALELVASARALLGELQEEGLDAVAVTPEASLDTPPKRTAPAALASPAPPAAVKSPTPPATPLVSESPTLGLDAVREELGDCQRCGLCEGRTSIVFGEGSPEAQLMFIGEGPGEQEDLQGRPFVGPAGELLTQMIENGLGLRRDEVYICNIVKCRPPRNRTPLANEVSACRPFLDGQIEAVRPRVIVTLGKPAASLLLDRDVAITRLRGTWQQYRGIPLMPTLHPAYILREYTAENRRNVWEDLKLALARAREP